jgi:hypothetical protein
VEILQFLIESILDAPFLMKSPFCVGLSGDVKLVGLVIVEDCGNDDDEDCDTCKFVGLILASLPPKIGPESGLIESGLMSFKIS